MPTTDNQSSPLICKILPTFMRKEQVETQQPFLQRACTTSAATAACQAVTTPGAPRIGVSQGLSTRSTGINKDALLQTASC